MEKHQLDHAQHSQTIRATQDTQTDSITSRANIFLWIIVQRQIQTSSKVTPKLSLEPPSGP
eukprot:2355947-Heterocapsa_arctica.AAC.1